MALQTEQEELIARYIEPDPDPWQPDMAWVADSSFHVKTIIRRMKTEGWDVQRTAKNFDLPVGAVRAAVAYYEQHKALIDARITLDEAWEQREGQLHEDTVVIPFLTLPTPQPEPRPKTAEDELIERYVETTPGRPTADVARVGDYTHSVKSIIRWLQWEGWDIEAAARFYDIPVDEIRAAVAYYQRHKAVIDARILLDQSRYGDHGA